VRLTASAPVSPAGKGKAGISPKTDTLARDGNILDTSTVSAGNEIIELSCSDSSSASVSGDEDTAHSGLRIASLQSPRWQRIQMMSGEPESARASRDPWILGRVPSRQVSSMPWEQQQQQRSAPLSEGIQARLSLGAAASPWSLSGSVEGSPSPLPLRQRLAAHLRQEPAGRITPTSVILLSLSSGPPRSPFLGEPTVFPLLGECGQAAEPNSFVEEAQVRGPSAVSGELDMSRSDDEALRHEISPQQNCVISLLTP